LVRLFSDLLIKLSFGLLAAVQKLLKLYLSLQIDLFHVLSLFSLLGFLFCKVVDHVRNFRDAGDELLFLLYGLILTLLDLQDSLVDLVVKLDLDFFRIESPNLFLDLGEHVSFLHSDVGLGACAHFGRNFTTKDS